MDYEENNIDDHEYNSEDCNSDVTENVENIQENIDKMYKIIKMFKKGKLEYYSPDYLNLCHLTLF